MEYIWFYISVIGIIAIIPIYFLSLEHTKLEKKYGIEKGKKIGAIFGYISGWSFFTFWFGIYISPQPRFTIPIFAELKFGPILNFSFPLFHIVIATPFIILAFWFGIVGVKTTTLETAETHRAKKIVDTGIYSVVRHPQYLGGLLGHIGIAILLSAMYALFFFPFMIIIVYLISWKEEKELLLEFGVQYEKYRKSVPMLIPRFRKNKE